MFKNISHVCKKMTLIAIVLSASHADHALSFPSPFTFLKTFAPCLSLSRLWNMIFLEMIDTTRNMYLVQAKKLFKKSGHTSELEQVQQQAINEYAKAKRIDYTTLSLVNYHEVERKDLLRKIPYALSAQEVLPLYTPDEEGGVYVHKQKFLIHKGIPVGWIDYCYYKQLNGVYDHGYIRYVGVAKKYRDRHYGAYLMTYALQEMQIAGVRTVSLHAADEAAAQFHKKIGFDIIKPPSLAMQRKIPYVTLPFSLFA